jgi:hypothetical protein
MIGRTAAQGILLPHIEGKSLLRFEVKFAPAQK